MEELKDIRGFEGLYKISSLGYVLSLRSGRPLKPSIDGWKYRQVYLCNQGTSVRFSLHRLVAKYFIDNPNNKPNVNHIDGDKGNNAVSNLEWVTQSENVLHDFRTGRRSHAGDMANNRKISGKDVLKIRSMLFEGLHPLDIAKQYNISDASVYDIRAGRTWKHI